MNRQIPRFIKSDREREIKAVIVPKIPVLRFHGIAVENIHHVEFDIYTRSRNRKIKPPVLEYQKTLKSRGGKKWTK
jgi:hypothetical protein